MRTLTWETFLESEDIVSGDIESHEDSSVFRGPIIKVEVEGDQVTFTTKWMARMRTGEARKTAVFLTRGHPLDDKMWERWDKKTLSVNKSLVRLSDIGNGRICWEVPLLGTMVFFPKGRNLDPSKVSGLTPEELA